VYSSVNVYECSPSVLDPSVLVGLVDPEHEDIGKVIDNELTKCMENTVLLTHKDVDSLSNIHIFNVITQEMHRKCPTLLAVLKSALSRKEKSENWFATIATVYGMLMHSRNNKASAVQKIYSSLAV